MGLLFTAASSQYLICTNPAILDYPFMVGLWAKIGATGSLATLFCMSDTGTTNNYLLIRKTTGENIGMVVIGGDTESITGTTAIVSGRWVFVFAQFRSATDRRVQLFNPGGTLSTSGPTSTSRVPTGLDTLTIGCTYTSAGASQFWDGIIAEFWITRGMIAPSSVTNQMIAAMAMGGPFSMPQMGGVIEYMSFGTGFPTRENQYTAGVPRHNWTAINTPALAPHPPLPYHYRRPDQVKRQLVI